MEGINLKASYLTKCIWWLIIIGVLLSSIIFLTLNIDLEYRYFLSMIFVFIGILIVFYLNRFEIEKIQFSKEKITLTFYNKFFFKKEPESYSKQEVKVKNKDSVLILYFNNNKIGIVRKDSLNSSDWQAFKEAISTLL